MNLLGVSEKKWGDELDLEQYDPSWSMYSTAGTIRLKLDDLLEYLPRNHSANDLIKDAYEKSVGIECGFELLTYNPQEYLLLLPLRDALRAVLSEVENVAHAVGSVMETSSESFSADFFSVRKDLNLLKSDLINWLSKLNQN